MCSQEATLPGHTHLPLFQCEHHDIISYHASSVFCEQWWRHIATFMITYKIINFNVSTTYFLCVICRRVDMSLLFVRRINFAYNTILVSGSESSHSRVTRASYNYDLESNGSFGHHFFHIKTRSSVEHSKIANRERSKWFSRVFPTWLAFLLFYVRHGTRRNKVILPFVQLNFT